jgi:hypothetical protein
LLSAGVQKIARLPGLRLHFRVLISDAPPAAALHRHLVKDRRVREVLFVALAD